MGRSWADEDNPRYSLPNLMVRRRFSAVSNHVARLVPFILRDARSACSSDRMSLCEARRLTLDASARVTRIGRAEPHARRASHG